MSVSNRHFLQQGPVVAALARSVALGLTQPLLERWFGKPDADIPGSLVQGESPPLPADLIHDYLEHLGSDPDAYGNQVPPHLFPQWTFPLATRTLEGIPYPLLSVMNGGCRMQVNGPLPVDTPFVTTARLESIDDNGRRAVLQQHITTGPQSNPEALVVDLYAIIPLSATKKSGSAAGAKARKGPKVSVPLDAREIDAWSLDEDAGLDFARFTGDVNPIHWFPAYARMSGFRSVILHGFGTLARVCESLRRAGLDGGGLREIDVRFTKPLVLPANVSFYTRDDEVFVGDAPGGAAYLAGTMRAGAAADADATAGQV